MKHEKPEIRFPATEEYPWTARDYDAAVATEVEVATIQALFPPREETSSTPDGNEYSALTQQIDAYYAKVAAELEPAKEMSPLERIKKITRSVLRRL